MSSFASRVTEHFQSGTMTRNQPWLAEMQPNMFVEMSKDLAKRKEVKGEGEDVDHVWTFDLTAFAQDWIKEFTTNTSIMLVPKPPKDYKPGDSDSQDNWRVVLTGPKAPGTKPGVQAEITFDPAKLEDFLGSIVIGQQDPLQAAKEIERTAAKGAHSFCFSENFEPLGLPPIHDPGGYGDPVVAAAQDNEQVLSIHIGSSSTMCPSAGSSFNPEFGAIAAPTASLSKR